MKKYFLLTIFIIGLLLTTAAHAQQNPATAAEVILTWHANNFYPSDFRGKPAVTENTPLRIAAEVVKKNKLVDTSRANFSWYVDGKVLQQGVGLKEILFTVTASEKSSHFLRVVIKNGLDSYERATSIPIEAHETVIETPFPGNLITHGSQIALRAVPYFFNISSITDLLFFWSINDNQPENNSNANQITISVGTPTTQDQSALSVDLKTTNQKNPLEYARKRISLTIF